MADLDGDDTDSSTSCSPAAPARLRARIMASGYKYQILGESERLQMECEDEMKDTERTTVCLKRCLILLGLISLALLVALVFVVARPGTGGTTLQTTQVCETPECVSTSAAILSRMDQSATPCRDMYRLACGKWIRDAVPPTGESGWDMFSVLATDNLERLRQIIEGHELLLRGKNSTAINKMKTWYQTCMDVDSLENQGISKLKELMATLGYWTVSPPPVGQQAWDRDHWSLQDTLVKTHKLLTTGLFRFYVHKDPNEEKRNEIEFAQSGLTLAYVDGYKSDKIRDGYLAYATKVGTLLGGNESDVRAKMTDVLEFEKNMSKIFVSDAEWQDPLKRNNKFNLSDFQRSLGDWVIIKDFLQEMFNGREFSDHTQVSVATPAYFSKLGELLASTDKETVANYLMWNVLDSLMKFLPGAYSRATLELSKAQSGQTSLLERWKFCLLETREAVGFASAALFVDKYFSAASKSKVEETLDQIRLEFTKLIETVKWLDAPTRLELKDKAQAMTMMVGYPDWMFEVDKLDERYEHLEVLDGKLFTNRLNNLAYSLNRSLHKYDKQPDPHAWGMLPDEVNAYYDPSFNHIVVPAGILRPPYYSPDYPDALVYGTIGVVIGHELTHGFDNRGRLYDKHGHLGELWTPTVEKGFDAAAKCMEDQYSGYSLHGHQLDGNLTLAENIADNGGIKLSYRAFKAKGQPSEARLPGLNLTDSQLFYLGFSQLWCAVKTPEYEVLNIKINVHSLPKFRVKGSLSNSDEFATAFACPVGTDLNPERKCEVW